MKLADDMSIRIRRSFRELSEETINAIEQHSILAQMGWSGAFGWDELLKATSKNPPFQSTDATQRVARPSEPFIFLKTPC